MPVSGYSGKSKKIWLDKIKHDTKIRLIGVGSWIRMIRERYDGMLRGQENIQVSYQDYGKC